MMIRKLPVKLSVVCMEWTMDSGLMEWTDGMEYQLTKIAIVFMAKL